MLWASVTFLPIGPLLESLYIIDYWLPDHWWYLQIGYIRISREDLIGRRLQAMAEQLCGGSMTPLLTHLVRAKRLSARERQDLRDLIDELDRQNKGKGDRR